MLYRERVLPGPTILVLGIGLFLMVGVAYSAAFGTLVGIGLALFTSVLYLAVTVVTAPQIRVEALEDAYILRAGRAKVDIALVGSAHQLTTVERIDLVRGVRGDTAFSIVKGKLPVVELHITDPLDPHGTWCLSSRRPDVFLSAIDSAKGPKNA
jgi:hypothetical protein